MSTRYTILDRTFDEQDLAALPPMEWIDVRRTIQPGCVQLGVDTEGHPYALLLETVVRWLKLPDGKTLTDIILRPVPELEGLYYTDATAPHDMMEIAQRSLRSIESVLLARLAKKFEPSKRKTVKA